MTPTDTFETIEQWLDEALRGLPTAEREVISTEIGAHFADAVEDYRQDGMSDVEANRTALADLGDARETGHALREKQISRRWYVAAAVIGAAFSVLVLIAFTMGASIAPAALGKVIQDLLILPPTFVVLLALARLLRGRTGTNRYEGPILGLIAMMVVANGAIDLRLAILPLPPSSFPWEFIEGPAMPLTIVSTAGLFASAVCLWWLGTRLLDLPDELYGLRRAILSMAIITGLAVFAFALGIVSGQLFVAELANMAALISHLSIMAVLALLFIRVVMRSRGHKLQAA